MGGVDDQRSSNACLIIDWRRDGGRTSPTKVARRVSLFLQQLTKREMGMKKSVRRKKSQARVAMKSKRQKSRKPPLPQRIEVLEELVDELRARLIYREQPRPVSERDLSLLAAAQDRFVRATSDGWLLVMTSGTKTSLPSGLKVSLTSTSGGRDNGVVLEGVLAGTTFDVSAGNLQTTFRRVDTLRADVKKRAGGPIVIGGTSYDLELRLSFKEGGVQKSIGPYAAKTEPTNPLPLGQHEMEIPDFPHDLGAPYGAHGKVWFRIGHTGDRYVHPGRVSEGCLTCAPSQWEEIYGVLDCARANDKISIGTLVVQ